MATPAKEVPPMLAIVGATAVGKSELALALAEECHGEIISVDSMQVYRGLDIGTAKPSQKERQCIPHHLIDVADLRERFDAAQFIRHAEAAVNEIKGRGKLPIFCGGTGLYFKAWLDGLGEAPAADVKLREELSGLSLEELLKELNEGDPATFAVIDQRNLRRVIRAVEVIRLTGKPFSEQRSDWKNRDEKKGSEIRFFGLARLAEELRARIDVRVENMFRAGLVEETEKLLAQGLKDNPTAMQAIGYRQTVDYLEKKGTLAATQELVKVRTRQFAKRQMTWFNRQLPVKWLELTDKTDFPAMARQIIAEIKDCK